MGGAMRKTSQKGLLIASFQRLEKDSDRAITPAAEAVHVPAHFMPPGSLQPKQLFHLHAQPSLEQSCHSQKKSCIYAHRVALVVSNSLWPCELWPAMHLCQGVLQARILEWAAISFSVQFSSVAQLCLTLCNPMDCSTPGLPVHHQIPGFT